MRKFWLACIIYFCSVLPTHAIEFTIHDATISGTYIDVTGYIGSTSNYYLQGALRSSSGGYFFSETQNNQGDWIDYVSSAEKEYITNNFYLTEPHDPSWSEIIHLRFRVDDPNYKGPGEYELELRRFTGGGKTSAGESDPLTINLTAATPAPSPTPTPSPTPPPTPTPTPSPSLAPSPTPTTKPSLKPSPSQSPVLTLPPDGTVAGESTEIDLSVFGVSPSPSLQGVSLKAPTINKSRVKTVLLIGSGLVLVALASFFGYRRYLATIKK